MKKRNLLAGTASVALGLVAGGAYADPIVKLGIDSYAEQGFIAHQSHDKGNGVGFRDRIRLDFNGSNVADNGLKYGVRVRIRTVGGNAGTGGTGTLDYDKGYIYGIGSFGEVNLGTQTGVSDIGRFLAPNDWGTGAGIDGDWANWINHIGFTTDENPVSAGSNSRAVYFTPRFAGFQGGVSFVPSSSARGQTLDRDKFATPGNGGNGGAFATTYRNVYEVGANYTNTFGGIQLNGSFYYEAGTPNSQTTSPNSAQSLQSYNVGAQVGWGGLLVGGGWTYAGKSGYANSFTSKKPQETWYVGPEYKIGPLVVGAQYWQMQDGGETNFSGVAGLAIQRAVSAGASYTVAPGLVTGLEYVHSWISHAQSLNANNGSFGAPIPGSTADVIILVQSVAF